MSQQEQEGESVGPSVRETRVSLPSFLTGRLAWVGLGALSSAVVASMAFAQGTWSDGETNTRTTAAEVPDQASEDAPKEPKEPKEPKVPLAPLALQASDSPSGPPKTGTPGGPKAVRKAVYMPGRRALAPEGTKPDAAPKHRRTDTAVAAPKRRGTDSTGGAPRGGSDTSPAQKARTNEGSRPKPGSGTEVLSASGSRKAEKNPHWGQNTVTVRSTVPITELKVVVRINQTGGVADTGVWTSLGDQVNVRSAANGEQLAYVVTLKPGITLQPGTFTFTFGFDHDTGTRDGSHDLWNVTATAAGSAGSQGRSGRF
jgi:hypothetical protein